MGGLLGVVSVDDVGVASCDGAELLRVGAGINSGGHRLVGEAQGAGCEKCSTGGWADEELQCSACEGVFFSCDLLRVGELAGWRDQGGRLQDFDAPVVEEGEIGRHGFGLM